MTPRQIATANIAIQLHESQNVSPVPKGAWSGGKAAPPGLLTACTQNQARQVCMHTVLHPLCVAWLPLKMPGTGLSGTGLSPSKHCNCTSL